MASPNSNDALGLLSAALSASDAASEAKHLRELYNVLAAQPGNVPILFPSILSLLSRANEPMRKWIADVMDLAFCRPTLSIEGRAAREYFQSETLSVNGGWGRCDETAQTRRGRRINLRCTAPCLGRSCHPLHH